MRNVIKLTEEPLTARGNSITKVILGTTDGSIVIRYEMSDRTEGSV